ncbi:uncharacterized protein OCT59_010900 [Rhizophagus irregularis]|uniref:Cdc15p n=4 Tax=Rhizophagus irregularis TaxID=588596 RepID=A0A015LB92_RHIIW|nr:Cdc15p [Rhizophagus irregularis DAOM 197198w]UZO19619.1 hypothetical protein OCT59_010900 [Rhizophagus irregularis]GBC12887.1 kinase-like domain-containing protein [Rhizophagus irregularis DAOM 181602=DAOM 197198]
MRSKIGYLEIINKSSISQRFRNFTSGSKQLDDYLKSTQKLNQENLINLPLFFIPYNEFDDIKLLKKGGEGIIYKSVWKIGLNGLEPEIVALKTLLNKSDMKKFINELDLQTKLFSTYIPLVYGVTKDFNNHYMIVMEYAKNGDLRNYLINNYNNLNFEDKLRILKEIISAIRDIHSNGLIHGDIHPGNILRSKNSFYVSDLGLCHPYTEKRNSRIIYGIPPYVAPEVFLSEHYGPEADIYGFSIIAWEILSGKKVYDNCPYDFDLIQSITTNNKRPPPINGTPLELWDLIQSCWDKDYTKRPKAKEIYTTLVKWLLFDKIYITWENDLKNGITENFIYITNDFDDDFLSIDNINNSNKVTGSTLSIHDRILTGKTTSSIISNNSSPENDDYVSMQIDLVIPNNLS